MLSLILTQTARCVLFSSSFCSLAPPHHSTLRRYAATAAKKPVMVSSERSKRLHPAALPSRPHDCAWGSSADAEFAPVAISKCEKTFLARLPSPAHDRYTEEMQLCAYEESRADGTIHISEAALCQADVAADYAMHPEKSNDHPLRASFNCASAKTPLETAICSHIALGHADIVLSRVYSGFRKELPPGRPSRPYPEPKGVALSAPA